MKAGRLSIVPYDRLEVASRVLEHTGVVEDFPAGPDWVHPSVRVRDTGSIGFGLVALDLIRRGSTVILFGGTMMSWDEVCSLPPDLIDIPFQVADDVFYGVARREDLGVGEMINHSCNPNVGFVSEIRLVALRDILPGEDVTMDYGTCTTHESYYLVCKCGQQCCRGVITGNDWRLRDLQFALRDYFQPYIQEKILEQRGRGLILTAFFSFRSIMSRAFFEAKKPR